MQNPLKDNCSGDYIGGTHVFIDAGEAELNEYQKKFYSQKLTEINDFLCALKKLSHNDGEIMPPRVSQELPRNISSASVINVSGKQFYIANVPCSSQSTAVSIPSALPIVSQTANQTMSSIPPRHAPPAPSFLRLRPGLQTLGSNNVSIQIRNGVSQQRTPGLQTLGSNNVSIQIPKAVSQQRTPMMTAHTKLIITPTPNPTTVLVPRNEAPPLNIPMVQITKNKILSDDLKPEHSNTRNVSQPQHVTSSNGPMGFPPTSSANKRGRASMDLPLLPLTRPELASESTTEIIPRGEDLSLTIGPVKSKSFSNSKMISEYSTSEAQTDKIEDRKSLANVKTFPSLLISVRPSLKIYQQALINNTRVTLDNKIKMVVQMRPKVRIEYFLQKGLLRSYQICKTHGKPLRLGEYSDPGKFMQHGGYVWFSECCSPSIHYVTKGSIFDNSLLDPQNILKLMYHWSCNTPVKNILTWVQVDNCVVKTYFTFFRAICTLTVSEMMPLLGGPKKTIQIGLISIGPNYDTVGNTQVKVDFLGALDPVTQKVRLRVLERSPYDSSNKVFESKFRQILEVLQTWVHPDSVVVTDFAVDASLAQIYGFRNVMLSSGSAGLNNFGIRDYLRGKIIPMFESTLNVLSLQIIQQFLDELVWRESWGGYPAIAFETLVENIAQITKLPGLDLVQKLKKVASRPFRNWKFSIFNATNEQLSDQPKAPTAAISPVLLSKTQAPQKVYKGAQPIQPNNPDFHEETKPFSSITAQSGVEKAVKMPVPYANNLPRREDEIIYLESYYYGVIKGGCGVQKAFVGLSGTFLAECPFCMRDFLTATVFAKHLIQHALNSNTDMSASSQKQLIDLCDECLHPVLDLDKHISSQHPGPKFDMSCLICQSNFSSKEKWFKHMSLVHCEKEVPYLCELCGFRTSVYGDVVNHFKLRHDKETCLQCPYCLKIVNFCMKDIEIPQNIIYFVQHIQKHNHEKLNRKCEKCVLSFINMDSMKEHQEKFHVSLAGSQEVENYQGKHLTKMPAPRVKPYLPVTFHESNFRNGRSFSSSIKVASYLSAYKCAECDCPITENHFNIKMTCSRCKYQSCCENAVREHANRSHSGSTPNVRTQILGGIPFLKKTVYCSKCSFSTRNGNYMAKHLFSCLTEIHRNGAGSGGGNYLKRKHCVATFAPPRKYPKTD